jgi:hypothetical protein
VTDIGQDEFGRDWGDALDAGAAPSDAESISEEQGMANNQACVILAVGMVLLAKAGDPVKADPIAEF